MLPATPNPVPSSSGGAVTKPLLYCFLLLVALICAYSLWVCPIGFLGDSYLFIDRAKHLVQQGNLDLNNHGSLIYPPLYSIVVAPIYALSGAARILVVITLLNSLFVASALFPVYCLLSHYAGIAKREALCLALIITASPVFVSYAPMVLSEAFFIPIVYWTAYAVFRSLTDFTPKWFLIAGLLLATGLLTRSAATGILLSGVGSWLLSLFLVVRIKPAKALTLLSIGLGAIVLPLVAWHLFEKTHVVYQGATEYSISDALKSLLASQSDQLIKLHWTINAIFYFLTAPLNLGAFLILVLLIRQPQLAWRDPLVPFAGTVITLAIASIVVLAPTSYGGNPLTWNKYFAPFVGLIPIIAFRLRPLVTRRLVLVAIGTAFVLAWLGQPSGLICHFPDSLSPFIDSARQLPASAWTRNGLFFIFLCGTTGLFAPFTSRKIYVVSIIITAGLCLFSNIACGIYWRNSGALNLKHYDGLAVRLQEAKQASPDLPVFYDPSILQNGPAGESLRFLFYYPALLPELARSALFLNGSRLPSHFLYITGAFLPSAHLLAKESESLRLYQVDGSQIGHDLAYTITYDKAVGGQETIPIDGKPVTVRWLGTEPEIIIHADQTVPVVQLGLRLSVCDHPRTVSATLNGKSLAGQFVVSRVAWNDGFDYIIWHVALKPGENRLILRNDAEPVTLPDGVRKVTFLLIDEPVLSKPDPVAP